MPSAITWKWLAGILLGVALAGAGYTFKGTDQRTINSEKRIAELDVDIQQEKVKSEVRYQEIQRQLAQLQHSLDRLEELVRTRRF